MIIFLASVLSLFYSCKSILVMICNLTYSLVECIWLFSHQNVVLQVFWTLDCCLVDQAYYLVGSWQLHYPFWKVNQLLLGSSLLKHSTVCHSDLSEWESNNYKQLFSIHCSDLKSFFWIRTMKSFTLDFEYGYLRWFCRDFSDWVCRVSCITISQVW